MPSPQRISVPQALAGQRLDRVLEALIDGHSRAQLQKLVRRGRVRLNGKRVTRSNVQVPRGAEVELEDEQRGAREAAPEVNVLHEDAHILVVEKPAGMLTHAASRSAASCVPEALEEAYGPLPTLLGEDRPGIVHRLDRETSGLLVLGRSDEAMGQLQDQFRAKRVDKTYLALVSNVPSAESFRVAQALGPVPGKLDRQMVSPPSGAKDATTDVTCVEAFERHALVACHPRTGRRHQIRVHLAHHGVPVLSDELYGTKSRQKVPAGVPHPGRLALHAHELGFRHPGSGEPVKFRSELPADLARTLEALRSQRP